MAFGMSPFPLQFGSRGGGASGDPTALSDEVFAAAGFSVARTGAARSQLLADQPSFEVVSANALTKRNVTVGDEEFSAIYLCGAAAPLLDKGRNLPDSAYTKTNTTAALALGGLIHDASWRGSQLIVNGTFDANITGWTAADGGTIAWSAGKLELTRTTTGVAYRTFGVVAGSAYLLTGTVAQVSGGGNGQIAVRSTSSTGSTTYAQSTTGAGAKSVLYISPVTATVYIQLVINSAAGVWTFDDVSNEPVDVHSLVTATADNGSVSRALTLSSASRGTLIAATPGAANTGVVKISQDAGSTQVTLANGSYQEAIVPNATTSNPTIDLQLTKSGDTVKVYGIWHSEQSAGGAMPLHVPVQGPSLGNLSATSIPKTLSAAPTAIDLDILAVVPLAGANKRILMIGDSNDRTCDLYFDGSGNVELFGRTSSVTSFTVSVASKTPGDLIRVSVKTSASLASLAVDGGTAATAVPSQSYPAVTAVLLGAYLGPSSIIDSPIVAIRDNNGQFGVNINKRAFAVYDAL